jgi:two-component system NarL family sensor kinase/two-component system sensor histidine kinase UhpB
VLLACLLAPVFPARRQAGPVQRLARALLDQEHWQLDELALSLLLLALALAGFAVGAPGGRPAAEPRADAAPDARRKTNAARWRANCTTRWDRIARPSAPPPATSCARDGDQANVQACAASIARSSEALHAMVRTMLRRLRPPALDSLGLDAALQALCDGWAQQHGIACRYASHAIPPARRQHGHRHLPPGAGRLDERGAPRRRRPCHGGIARRCARRAAPGHRRQWPGCARTTRNTADSACWALRERVAGGLRGHIRWISALGNGLRIEVAMPLTAGAA